MSVGTGGEFSLVQPGMEVYSSDVEQLGQVQEVRTSGFTLHRRKGEPRFVPRDAVAEVSEAEHRVDLSIPAAEIDTIDWKNPAP